MVVILIGPEYRHLAESRAGEKSSKKAGKLSRLLVMFKI